MDLLSRVRIVLVEPQHPGNIGAAARAMKTMGLRDLALVKPSCKFPHKDATDMAVGASDLLETARVFPDLRSAVADCGYVVGSSARLRSLPHNTTTPRELAARLARDLERIRPIEVPHDEIAGRARGGDGDVFEGLHGGQIIEESAIAVSLRARQAFGITPTLRANSR